MEESLKQAIQSMKNGDEKGFNEIYSKTYNRVYFRAKQIMKKEEDAQDLTQIVFIEAYKNIHTLQQIEALYSWLDGITYRQGMKIFRKKKDILLAEEAEGLFDTLENNDISSVPELTADQKATSEIIQGILEELPELQKTAVVMYYYDGLKVEQIAELMECSVNTIKSRLNYARKFIKERVEEKEKKEGYRLHAFGLPILWFAIKTLSDKTMLTAQAAQGVYDGVCSNVGLQATAITTIGGAGTVVTGGTASGVTAGVAGEAVKTIGLGAKFTSLSTAMKALIVAGSVTVAGLGTAGVVHIVNNNMEAAIVSEVEEEEQLKGEQEAKLTLEDDLSQYLGLYFGEYWREDAAVVYPYKVSDTEYRFRPEDLLQYGEKIKCAFVLDNLEHIPDGIQVAVAAYDTVEKRIPDLLVPSYMHWYDVDAWTYDIYAGNGFIIKLVDTNVKSLYEAWELEEDYSEFIKMYEVDVSEKYVFDYKYDVPSLTATKVSDTEYRFTVEDLQNTYRDGRMVAIRLNLPCTIELMSVVGTDCYRPGTLINYFEEDTEAHNKFYFTLSTQADIIVKVKKYEGNHEKLVDEVPQEQMQEQPKTLAEMNLSEYEKWEAADGYEGATLYVKKVATHTKEIVDELIFETGEYEGYWTLDGQEFHFKGKDYDVLELTDLEGNPIDRRIAFYDLSDMGMIFVDVPDEEGWDSYAFRDYPDYVYERKSEQVLD